MVAFAWLRGFVVILLVAANAFFVAAELALVSVRDTRIQQLIEARRIGARTVQKLHRNLYDVLSAVQFGITLASLGLGWIGEPVIAELLKPPLSVLPHSTVYAHVTAIAIAFAIITFLHVVLGELVPKSLALERAERVALAVSGPMDVFMTLSRPAFRSFSRAANLVLRLFGSHEVREGGAHSPEELKLVVTASRRVGLLPQLQEEIVHRSLELDNLTVREIMVPRPGIFSLPADMPLDEAMARVLEMQHSRVPVYDPQLGPDQIVGLLYSKDLSRFMHQRLTAERNHGQPVHMQVRQLMRDVLVVPETKPLSDLLVEFRQRRRHLAVVVDEFGSTAGLVTVEDVLEQIVGELEDEFDVAVVPPLAIGAGGVALDGSETLRDLEVRYQLRLPRDEGFETLAGFVLARLGKIPLGGESFDHDGRRYTVLQMEGRRIARVKLEPAQIPAGRQARM